MQKALDELALEAEPEQAFTLDEIEDEEPEYQFKLTQGTKCRTS